ncbi:hypothetical protein [Streptomyces sp. NBC_01320]|uniref:LexA family protein n=1 Tax=Streptomyces sp. NBC_01320 TaxID=2903824 RepID=UPI002E1575C5|nr:hypothetical protein OG395_57245 [Streptomyces sp. NBC_01320]
MSADGLTARREAVLRAIRDVIADTGDAPTIREIEQRVVQPWLGRLPARPAGEPWADQPAAGVPVDSPGSRKTKAVPGLGRVTASTPL